eukprot:15079812-Ditylum_brightwellii.AAC.1
MEFFTLSQDLKFQSIKRFFVLSGPTDAKQNQQEKYTAIGHAYVQMAVDKPKALAIMKHTHQLYNGPQLESS